MYTDINNRIAADLSLSGSSNVTYTNGIDLGSARELGEGQDLYCLFTITQLVPNTGNGSSTITGVYFEVGISSSTTPNFVTLGGSATWTPAQLVPGATIAVRINPVLLAAGTSPNDVPVTGKRYLYARSVIQGPSGANEGVFGTNKGAFTCDVVTDIQDGKKFYPSGISFS
jgi:hypothetical protein